MTDGPSAQLPIMIKDSHAGLWLRQARLRVARTLVQFLNTLTLLSQCAEGGQAPTEVPIITKHSRALEINPKSKLLLSTGEWSSKMPVTDPWLRVLPPDRLVHLEEALMD